jgi:hypothetical protein
MKKKNKKNENYLAFCSNQFFVLKNKGKKLSAKSYVIVYFFPKNNNERPGRITI